MSCSDTCALTAASCSEKAGDILSGINPALSKRSAVPRHTEIGDLLAKKICKDLGIPPVK